MEYWLWSFVPWLASISLDVAVEDDVVQNPAHVVLIISEIPKIPSLQSLGLAIWHGNGFI